VQTSRSRAHYSLHLSRRSTSFSLAHREISNCLEEERSIVDAKLNFLVLSLFLETPQLDTCSSGSCNQGKMARGYPTRPNLPRTLVPGARCGTTPTQELHRSTSRNQLSYSKPSLFWRALLLDCWKCENPIGTISFGNPSHELVRFVAAPDRERGLPLGLDRRLRDDPLVVGCREDLAQRVVPSLSWSAPPLPWLG
jgi:hypothetical protein